MVRILTGMTILFLLGGNALAQNTQDPFRQLRPDPSNVHPQSMAASYGAQKSSYASKPVAFGQREFKVKATVDFSSEYVFRGQQFAKHNAQGGLDISSSGFYVGAWAVIPTKDDFDAYQTEIDVYGGYGLDLTSSVYADVGVNGYIFNSPQLLFARKDAVEVYGGLAIKAPFSPSLYGFYDFETDAATAEASLQYLLPFGRTDLVLGATGGYTNGDEFEYTYLQTDVEIIYNFNRQASLGLGGHWAISENERFLDGLSLTDDNSTWYGITIKARN